MSAPLTDLGATQFLKATTGRCPVCRRACPAEVHLAPGDPARVVMFRECDAHGETVSLLSSDARFYWLSQGASSGCCGDGTACRANDKAPAGTLGRNAGLAREPFETLSTCLALIELVPTCNLACPVCYADSPVEAASGSLPDLAALQARVQGVIDRKGRLDILQLSGGEPTLHPEFFAFLAWAQDHPEITYVLLNTNGVKLASDEAFASELAARWRRGKFQIYLQFDGVQEGGQRLLRGGDLRPMRERALARCREAGIPVTLAMTVTPETLPGLWATVQFGLCWDNVRGVSFQPLFQSGRVPTVPGRRLNVADILLALIGQSEGALAADDFTPLPCGDPNCAVIGYLFKTPAGVRSVREFLDFTAVQGFLKDRVRYNLDDLAQCGCESEPLGELLKLLELDERHTFRLFLKPFMDTESWDEDRIDRCCTHVIRPDGKLDSFCRYYAQFPVAASVP